MIVQNKKTLIEYEITEKDYQKLVESRSHRLFTIISKTDNPKGKVLVPKEILEYQKPKDLKIETKSTEPKSKPETKETK